MWLGKIKCEANCVGISCVSFGCKGTNAKRKILFLIMLTLGESSARVKNVYRSKINQGNKLSSRFADNLIRLHINESCTGYVTRIIISHRWTKTKRAEYLYLLPSPNKVCLFILSSPIGEDAWKAEEVERGRGEA